MFQWEHADYTGWLYKLHAALPKKPSLLSLRGKKNRLCPCLPAYLDITRDSPLTHSTVGHSRFPGLCEAQPETQVKEPQSHPPPPHVSLSVTTQLC